MVCRRCCDTRLVHDLPRGTRQCPDCASLTVIEHTRLVYERAVDRDYAELFLQLQVDAGFVDVDEAVQLRAGRKHLNSQHGYPDAYCQLSLFD